MSARTGTTPKTAAIRADLNAIVDRWIGLRAYRAFSPVGYTPAKDLYKDFADWHVAVFPDQETPADSAFVQSLRAGFKIRFEVLQVQKAFAGKNMALCVNLTLVEPIRAVA